jgi:hypothetical protein
MAISSTTQSLFLLTIPPIMAELFAQYWFLANLGEIRPFQSKFVRIFAEICLKSAE